MAQTRSRLAQVIAPERTLFTVVKAHERFYTEELADVTPSRIVAQPSNKGTTAAIIYSLQRLASLAGDPIAGFFPTDHHYSGEARFAASLRLALQIARTRPETVILLGANAEYPEVEYGWIEPGTTLECPFTNSLLRVNRFWEKPALPVAEALLDHGCLWNTFVMIGRASAFLDILRKAVPQMVRESHGDPGPEPFRQGDFSQQVLAVSAERLAVLRLGGVSWSDLGTPERVMSAMARAGHRSNGQELNHHANLEDLAKASAS
jgi:mannose-1-phosphate guanylyltransferase